MKIRFSKSDQIDTTNIEGGAGSSEEVNAINDVINDGIVDTDDYTRLNYVLRALRALMYWAYTQDSGDPSLKSLVEELFGDILSFEGKQADDSWGVLKDKFFEYNEELGGEEEPIE